MLNSNSPTEFFEYNSYEYHGEEAGVCSITVCGHDRQTAEPDADDGRDGICGQFHRDYVSVFHCHGSGDWQRVRRHVSLFHISPDCDADPCGCAGISSAGYGNTACFLSSGDQKIRGGKAQRDGIKDCSFGQGLPKR